MTTHFVGPYGYSLVPTPAPLYTHQTPSERAARDELRKRDGECAKALQSQDAFYFQHLFTQALRSNDTILISLIIMAKLGVDLSRVDEAGITPLIYAVHHNNLQIMALLLQYGADPNGMSPGESSPLSIAIWTEKKAAVELLLQGGADPGLFDESGNTPLEFTYTLKNPLKQEVIALLLARGADKNKTYRYLCMKYAGLCWTLRGGVSESSSKGNRFFYLEGGSRQTTPLVFYDYFDRFIHSTDSPGSLSPAAALSHAEKDSLREVVEHMYPLIDISASELVARIKDGLPCMIVKGFDKPHHGICYVFHNNKVMLCNRGYGSSSPGIQIFETSQDHFSEEFFQKFLATKSLDTAVSLIRSLGAKWVKAIAQKEQKTGNCSWISVESGYLAVLYCILKSEDRAKAVYKDFTTKCRCWSFTDCVKASSQTQLNPALLGMIREKIFENSSRFDPTTRVQMLRTIEAKLPKF